jgi:hypothetical protein
MMNISKNSRVVRGFLVITILLSGLLLIPFIDMPAEALGWELFAGIYAPELTVNQSSGVPGSVFAFTGSNYPANSQAEVYVNGVWKGMLMTDANGVAEFLLDTTGSSVGAYNVTLEVDINASATQSIELVDTGEVVTPPPDFEGPKFTLTNTIFMPVISNQ